MSLVSKDKEKRIKEDVLRVLYENSPKKLYTYFIAEELARDDEFMLRLLNELHQEGLINKFQKGRKNLWGLPDSVFNKYKEILS